MPLYVFIRTGNHARQMHDLPSDLAARKAAEARPGVVRVETDTGRVVWRNVPESFAGMTPHKKTWLDIDMVEWFDRAKESK